MQKLADRRNNIWFRCTPYCLICVGINKAVLNVKQIQNSRYGTVVLNFATFWCPVNANSQIFFPVYCSYTNDDKPFHKSMNRQKTACLPNFAASYLAVYIPPMPFVRNFEGWKAGRIFGLPFALSSIPRWFLACAYEMLNAPFIFYNRDCFLL